MPTKTIDYSRTIIYKIVCNDLNVVDCYVGSTTNFTNRKNQHKRNKMKIYETMRANGGWDNWSIIEIEKYPCKDNNEARKREREWFEEFNSTLNSYRPSSTKEENK